MTMANMIPNASPAFWLGVAPLEVEVDVPVESEVGMDVGMGPTVGDTDGDSEGVESTVDSAACRPLVSTRVACCACARPYTGSNHSGATVRVGPAALPKAPQSSSSPQPCLGGSPSHCDTPHHSTTSTRVSITAGCRMTVARAPTRWG